MKKSDDKAGQVYAFIRANIEHIEHFYEQLRERRPDLQCRDLGVLLIDCNDPTGRMIADVMHSGVGTFANHVNSDTHIPTMHAVVPRAMLVRLMEVQHGPVVPDLKAAPANKLPVVCLHSGSVGIALMDPPVRIPEPELN